MEETVYKLDTCRKAVISLAVMEEAVVEEREELEVVRGKEEEDIGSPFEWMDTVYV